MSQLFICYRRADSLAAVRRMYQQLSARYSSRRVFRDIDDFAGGVSFSDQLREALRNSNVVLIVIGPTWTTLRNSNGMRRLDDPGDYVRLEVEHALSSSARVVPVLISNAVMPTAEDVPMSLLPLLELHALPIRPHRFKADVARLMAHIDVDMKTRVSTPLYNGRDLTGWQLVGPHTTAVESRENTLICANGSTQPGYIDHLMTTRSDFRDFELFFEVLIDTAAAPAIVQIRTDPSQITFGGMRGYAVSICGTDVTVQQRPGATESHRWSSTLTALSLMSRARHGFGLTEASHEALPLGIWHRVEIRVSGRRLRVWINRRLPVSARVPTNDEPIIDYSDNGQTLTSGAIAFAFYPGCRVKYRNIRLRRLSKGRGDDVRTKRRWTHRQMIGNEWNERWQTFQHAGGREWIESVTDVEGFWQHLFSEVDRTETYVELQRERGPNERVVVRLFSDHSECGAARDRLTDVREGHWEI